MPAPKKIRKETLVALAADAAAGATTRALTTKYEGTSERVIRLIKRSGIGVEEFHARVEGKVRAAADESIDAYRQALRDGRIPPSQLALSTGIMLTKAAEFESRNAVANINVSELINRYEGPFGASREEVSARLRGDFTTVFPRPVVSQ